MRHARRQRIWIALLCFSAFEASAANPGQRSERPAWRWTVEERLGQRFDPDAIRQRLIAYEKAHPQLRKAPAPQALDHAAHDDRIVSYVIDGRRNPELFLPHELFATLLTGVVPNEPLRTRQRSYYGAAIRAFGFDDALFWARLEEAAGPLGRRADGARNTSDERCREHYQALESARAAFGRERFDEFLYVVVAPSKQHASTTSVKDPSAALERTAKGCSE